MLWFLTFARFLLSLNFRQQHSFKPDNMSAVKALSSTISPLFAFFLFQSTAGQGDHDAEGGPQ